MQALSTLVSSAMKHISDMIPDQLEEFFHTIPWSQMGWWGMPTVALVYATAVACFLPFFGEGEPMDQVPHWLWRFALWTTAVVSYWLRDPTNPLLFLDSWMYTVLSIYSLIRTRMDNVEGGPAPHIRPKKTASPTIATNIAQVLLTTSTSIVEESATSNAEESIMDTSMAEDMIAGTTSNAGETLITSTGTISTKDSPATTPTDSATTATDKVIATTTATSNDETNPPPPPPSQPSHGLIVVITGGNAGIGKATAQLLCQQAPVAKVVLACRSLERAQDAIHDLVQSTASSPQGVIRKDQLDCIALDLCRLDSVRTAAAQLKEKYPRIDVLINNAGIMLGTQEFTKDGYDAVMQANYLGHYLWTRLLIDCIPPTTGRVLNITSAMYGLTKRLDIDNLHCNKKDGRSYTLFGQYIQSKLAQVLFTHELARRYPDIHVHAIHPGMVRTEVTRNMPLYMRLPNHIFAGMVALFQKTPMQGAWCTAHVATTQRLGPSGSYWVNRRVQTTRPCANDDVMARQLWKMSAQLVGLSDE
jgi:retinol dehydrogenase 12